MCTTDDPCRGRGVDATNPGRPACGLVGPRAGDGSSLLRKGDRYDRVELGLRFRALRPIAADDEITFCYLPDLDLRAEFRERRRAIASRGWKFVCHCDRCVAEARAFLATARAAAVVEEAEDDECAVMVEAIF